MPSFARAPQRPTARARWLFFIAALASAVVLAGMLIVATPRNLEGCWAAGAAILALLLHWYHGYRRERFAPASVLLDGLALTVIATAIGMPARALGVFYTGLNFRALYGSRRSTVALFLAYTGAYTAAEMIGRPPDRWLAMLPGRLLPQILGFAFAAAVLYALEQSLEQQERMGDALRESERRYRLVFENNPFPMWVFELASQRITDVNQAAIAHYGYTRSEFLAMRLADLRSPDDVGRLEDILAGLSTTDGATHLVRHRKKDGTTMEIEAIGHSLDHSMPGLRIVLANDVTDRLAAERELRATNRMLRELIDLAPQAIVAVDLDWRVTRWNHAAERIFGWSEAEVLGRPLPYVPPDQMDAFLGRMSAEAQDRGLALVETKRLRKDGTPIDVLISTAVLHDARGARSGFLAILNDITESKRLEAQLRQAQKMEAVGQLAGGVAHDFNNLLTSIKCSTTFLMDAMEPGDPRRADVRDIEDAATRAATLTRHLLAFSRKQVLQPVVLDPNALITDLGKMLRRLVPENIQQTLALDPGAGHVLADPGQLEQVIINLVVNARDAMPHGGTLTIGTAQVELTSGAAAWQHTATALVPGAYVVLSVSDTGCGMDRATQERIFEPFFTTKGVGQGTGLGLSTVYGIVKQSTGYIWVYSEPGKGSVFKVYLPRVDRAAGPPPRERTAGARPRGSERILVVEDDAAVRAVVGRLLASQGYTVLTAASAEDALTVMGQAQGHVDLVLTDIVMPGISGPALVEQIAARARPNGHPVRALFMSGYTRSHVAQGGILGAEMELLEKPFTPAQLAERVRSVLDRAAVA